jgi:hypothetical protein
MIKSGHGGGIYFGFCPPITTVTGAEGFTERQTTLGRISSAGPEPRRPEPVRVRNPSLRGALQLLSFPGAGRAERVSRNTARKTLGLSLGERFLCKQ